MKLQTVCLKLCAIPCLIVPAYSFTPRGMVCTRTLQPLGHVGGGMVNMLSSYCIPAQRMAAAVVARAASALRRTCTASPKPGDAAVPALLHVHVLMGGWQQVAASNLPTTVIRWHFRSIWVPHRNQDCAGRSQAFSALFVWNCAHDPGASRLYPQPLRFWIIARARCSSWATWVAEWSICCQVVAFLRKGVGSCSFCAWCICN